MLGRARRPRPYRGLVLVSALALAALTPIPAAGSATGTENINLTLPLGLHMSGHVTLPGGGAASEANVGVCPDEFSCFSAGTQTAPDGSYTVVGIVPGTYYVKADLPGYLEVWLGAGGTSVTDFAEASQLDISTDVTSVDLELAAGLSVSGTLTDPDGQPVGGIAMSVSGDGAGASTTSDSNGDYVMTGLVPGWYTMEIRPPADSLFTTGTVSNGTVIKDFEPALFLDANLSGFDVELVEGRSITGTITGLTQLADVSASTADHTFEVAEDGSFTVRGLWPDDPTQLWFSHRPLSAFDEQFPIGVYDGTSNLSPDQSTAADIDVSAGDVDLGTIAAPTLPTISGTVIDDLDNPVPGWVTLCGELGCASSSLASDGSYAFLNLPNSTFTMYIVSSNHLDGYLTDSGTVSRDYADARQIVVADQDHVFDAELLIGLSMSGRITGPGGVPAVGISVGVSDESTSTFGQGITDQDGNYVITGLREGDYIVRAHAEGTPYFSGYWSFGGYVPDVESADPVHVPFDLTVVLSTDPADGATGVSRSVHPSVTFSGDVTNASTTTITLRLQGSSTLIKGTVAYDAGTHTATFTPKTKLRGRTAYVLEVSGILATGDVAVPPGTATFTTRR